MRGLANRHQEEDERTNSQLNRMLVGDALRAMILLMD